MNPESKKATRNAGPDWDMSAYFPEFGGADYQAFRQRLTTDMAMLQADIEALGSIDDAREDWTGFAARLEDVFARHRHLGSYLGCLQAADAHDREVERDAAALSVSRADLEKIFVPFRSALAEVDDAAFDRWIAHPKLAPVAYFLRRARRRARQSMSGSLEELAAELGVTGLSAWGRLYDRISGTLEFDLALPGQTPQRLPVSQARSLMGDADPEVRRAALVGSNQAWASVGETMAACLNAISGTRLTLYRRRGVDHFLEPALFDSGISQRTLETMFDVARQRVEVPRAFLREKAKRSGRERLGFQDLEAPAPGQPTRRVSFDEARRRVGKAFGRFYPSLGVFADEAFENRWIDWSTRRGKRPGGFCSSSPLLAESRIFMTFDGALGDVSTLAHELGHAWHSRVMQDMRPWARVYPMTLAETASTFAEQIVIDAVLGDPSAPESERAAMLDGRLQDATAFLLNIPMRFTFERGVYEERAHGELGAEQLCEHMRTAQLDWYADALDPDELDPWFWASKLHFYITGLSFYNFPYTFGYLFSLGLFARARQEGPDFLRAYEELLRDTASATAEEVAQRHLGIDLEGEDFWHQSIDLVASDLEAYLSMRP
jgi:oligoendopeptidase F